MSLFPGPQGRLLRSGQEVTTEHVAASQIFLQVGLVCMVRGDLTSGWGVPFLRPEPAAECSTAQKWLRRETPAVHISREPLTYGSV